MAAALDTERIRSPISLSQPETDGSDDPYTELEVQDGGYELGESRALLAAGFRILDERERRLLVLQFFAGLSQPQVARELGISQIHVSRLTRLALAKLGKADEARAQFAQAARLDLTADERAELARVSQ